MIPSGLPAFFLGESPSRFSTSKPISDQEAARKVGEGQRLPSGLIFGWFDFLMARCFADRSVITFGTALVFGVLFGVILRGVLPGQRGVSQEEHRFGAYAGATDLPPVKSVIVM